MLLERVVNIPKTFVNKVLNRMSKKTYAAFEKKHGYSYEEFAEHWTAKANNFDQVMFCNRNFKEKAISNLLAGAENEVGIYLPSLNGRYYSKPAAYMDDLITYAERTDGNIRVVVENGGDKNLKSLISHFNDKSRIQVGVLKFDDQNVNDAFNYFVYADANRSFEIGNVDKKLGPVRYNDEQSVLALQGDLDTLFERCEVILP